MTRVVTISVGKRAVKAVCCPGNDANGCGTILTHAGECPYRECRRYMSRAEFDAAIRAASATVEAGEAAA